MKTTYLDALTHHPKVVRVLVDKIQKGTSNRKFTDPATWDWSYKPWRLVTGTGNVDGCDLLVTLGRAWARETVGGKPDWVTW